MDPALISLDVLDYLGKTSRVFELLLRTVMLAMLEHGGTYISYDRGWPSSGLCNVVLTHSDPYSNAEMIADPSINSLSNVTVSDT